MRNKTHGTTAIFATLACVAVLLSPFTIRSASAVDVYTEPVGFYKVTLKTNTDTIVSVPFTRIPDFNGLVASVASPVITVSNSPGWAANQWATPNGVGVRPYYVKLENGSKEGAFYTITASGTSTLTVDLAPEDLTGVAAGDRIRIIPYWTLNTVWPGGTGVVASTSATAGGRRSQILFPNLTKVGISIPPNNTYFFYNNNWRRAGSPATSNFNDVVILPDQYVIGRQATNLTDTTEFAAPGLVPLSKLRIPFYANGVGNVTQQDNFVALYRPAIQTLDQSDLTNAWVASTSATATGRKDQLLTFDNAKAGINKPPANTYFYYNNGWRRAGSPATVNFGPSNILNTAEGYIVRKTSNTVGTIWVNKANYTN